MSEDQQLAAVDVGEKMVHAYQQLPAVDDVGKKIGVRVSSTRCC